MEGKLSLGARNLLVPCSSCSCMCTLYIKLIEIGFQLILAVYLSVNTLCTYFRALHISWYELENRVHTCVHIHLF